MRHYSIFSTYAIYLKPVVFFKTAAERKKVPKLELNLNSKLCQVMIEMLAQHIAPLLSCQNTK
jgi:hypothetical protein